MQFGVRSITMDEIAVSLGVSKKTIYQFYADKDELVEAVMIDIISFNQECCSNDKLLSKDAIHEVFMSMRMMQEMFENMNPSVLHELEKYYPRAFERFLQHKHNFLYKVLKENIEKGIIQELYRPDVDPDVLVKARLELIMLPFNQQVFPKNKFRLLDVQTQLTEHYLFGLVSAKGHKLILRYQQERSKQKHDEKKTVK